MKDAQNMNSQLEEFNRQIRNFEKRRGFKSDQTTKLKERCEKPASGEQKEDKREQTDMEGNVEEEAKKQAEDQQGMIEVQMVASEVQVLVSEVKVCRFSSLCYHHSPTNRYRTSLTPPSESRSP